MIGMITQICDNCYEAMRSTRYLAGVILINDLLWTPYRSQEIICTIVSLMCSSSKISSDILLVHNNLYLHIAKTLTGTFAVDL